MEKKKFMEEYSELMAAAAFADACGPIADIELDESSDERHSETPAVNMQRQVPAV